MTTEEQKIITQGRRYLEAQQAKIETQRVFIRDLENAGKDQELSRLKKKTLGENDQIVRLDSASASTGG
jgi:hypothetical protein